MYSSENRPFELAFNSSTVFLKYSLLGSNYSSSSFVTLLKNFSNSFQSIFPPPIYAVAITILYTKGVIEMTQLTVTIPEQYVVITREEYNELKDKEKPIWWSMQDLINETGFEYKWLRDNILLNPRYTKELKKFVYYPEGGKWAFNREPMQKFLREHFSEIFKKEG